MLNRGELLELLESEYQEIKGTQRMLREEDDIRGLGVDSLQVVELIHSVEERVGIQLIGDSRIQHVRTVGDVVELALEVQSESGAGVGG